MYQTLLGDSSLYQVLIKVDEDLATQARQSGCSCGGKLHSARYPRKPRGVPAPLEEAYRKRHSFCCAQEGCRKRTTPASFRFLGRKVFVSAVVVLVTALRHGVTPSRMAKIRELVGVSRRTVERWRAWWQETFVRSQVWKTTRGLLPRPVDESTLPLSLLEAFPFQDHKTRLVQLLQRILPLSTSSCSVQAIGGSLLTRRRCIFPAAGQP